MKFAPAGNEVTIAAAITKADWWKLMGPDWWQLGIVAGNEGRDSG